MKPEHPTSPICTLPTEIHTLIISHLPKTSQCALNRTSHLFQSICEPLIWSNMDLSLFPTEVEFTCAERRFRELNDRSWSDGCSGFDGGCDSDMSLRTAGGVMQVLVSAINRNLDRASYVRTLRGVVAPEHSIALCELVKRLSGNLVEIYLKGERYPASSGGVEEVVEQFRHRLEGKKLELELPWLKRLSIPLNGSWQALTHHFLQLTSDTLESLTILSSNRFVDVSKPPSQIKVPFLPRLKNLMVELTIESFIPFLISVVQNAPNLTQVKLWTSCSRREKSWWGPLVDVLREHEGVRVIEMEARIPMGFESGGFEGVEEVCLMRAYDGCYAQPLDECLIPPLPNLTRLIMSPARSHNHASLYGLPPRIFPCTLRPLPTLHHNIPAWAPAPPQSVPLPKAVAQRILFAPSLLRILMPAKIFPSTLASESWVETVSGEMVVEDVIIRTYHRYQDRNGEERSQVLVWCKANSHRVRDASGKEEHLEVALMQDWIWFDGHDVGLMELERFEKVGGEVGWTEPGRGLRLSDEEWAAFGIQ